MSTPSFLCTHWRRSVVKVGVGIRISQARLSNFFRFRPKSMISKYSQLRKKAYFYGLHILQVAQIWHRDRASSTILRGWVTLRLDFRLKGYVSRH